MRIHPVTGMPLEDGRGALPDDQQAIVLHIPYIEQTQGKAVADEMRKKLGLQTDADRAALDERTKLAFAALAEKEAAAAAPKPAQLDPKALEAGIAAAIEAAIKPKDATDG